MKRLLFYLFSYLFLSGLHAQTGSLSSPKLERKTQVLILAGPHISQYEEYVNAESFDDLIEVLKNWGPDLIGIEAQEGRVVAKQELLPSAYAAVSSQFSGHILELAKEAQDYLGLDFDTAQRVKDSLDSQAGSFKNMDHEYLSSYILYSLATYEYYSAVLAWMYGKQNRDLPLEIARKLEEESREVNEIQMIGLRLAHELGHSRIYQIDDHSDKDLFMKIAGTLSQELQNSPQMQAVVKAPLFQEIQEQTIQEFKKKNILPLYVKMNSKSYQEEDFDLQWNLFLRTQFKSGTDRKRLALWELRNLEMASHIRRATAMHPGKKALIIVGSSHKIFLDNYLGNMLDLEIIHLDDILP